MYCRYDKVVYVDAYFNPDSFTTFFHLPILEAVLLFEGLEKRVFALPNRICFRSKSTSPLTRLVGNFESPREKYGKDSGRFPGMGVCGVDFTILENRKREGISH